MHSKCMARSIELSLKRAFITSIDFRGGIFTVKSLMSAMMLALAALLDRAFKRARLTSIDDEPFHKGEMKMIE